MSSGTGFKQVARAFLAKRTLRLKNDESFGDILTFHGNTIAVRKVDGSIEVTLAGWNTVTTRARINWLSDLLDSGTRVFQRNFAPFVFDWRNRGDGEREISSRDWFTL